jgi:hypothetical protein
MAVVVVFSNAYFVSAALTLVYFHVIGNSFFGEAPPVGA